MATFVDHADSQLCPRGRHGASHTVGACGGGGHREPAPPSDLARRTSVSAQPRLAGAVRPPFPSSRPFEAISSLASPLRPARWFPLRSTPATEMVSPCCLPSRNPRTRAGMPLSVVIRARSPAAQSSVALGAVPLF